MCRWFAATGEGDEAKVELVNSSTMNPEGSRVDFCSSGFCLRPLKEVGGEGECVRVLGQVEVRDSSRATIVRTAPWVQGRACVCCEFDSDGAVLGGKDEHGKS
jgi:hypothetical protein